MEIDLTQVLVASIPAVVAAIASVYTARQTNLIETKAKMNAAKQSILQMIMEDKMNVMEGKFPENYQNILMEFDDYKDAKGNHYIAKKVKDYEEWYEKQQQK